MKKEIKAVCIRIEGTDNKLKLNELYLLKRIDSEYVHVIYKGESLGNWFANRFKVVSNLIKRTGTL